MENLEKEIVDIIVEVSQKAKRFRFGYFTEQDIVQEAILLCLKALPKWDRTRNLRPFLARTVRNRLINLKRDLYRRTESPCKLCWRKLEGATSHEDKMYCEKHRKWVKRNFVKSNIIVPFDNLKVFDKGTYFSGFDDVDRQDSIEFLDRTMPIYLRKLYLQYREGVDIGKIKEKYLEQEIKGILGDNED